MMQTKRFFKLILAFTFLIGNHEIQAQDCKVTLEYVVDGSLCAPDGLVTLTINAIAGEGSQLDTKNNIYMISSGQDRIPLPEGTNTVKVAYGKKYSIYSRGMLCNGNPVTPEGIPFTAELAEMSITKAEYKRCSASEISVSATVLRGTGPYTCQLIADEKVIDTKSSADKDITFSATTTSDNLKIEVIDDGCSKNKPVKKNLEPNFSMPVIEGDRAACKGGVIELTVTNTHSGSNFQWKKGNDVITSTNTLKLSNISEADAGEYVFSMNFDGCSSVYSETVKIEVGNPPTPNVPAPAYICFNSGEVSLSKYASKTSNAYVLVWYNSNKSLIGETAPMFKPNLPDTTKYFVSQKNSTGCESPTIELSVIVENLPAKAGENNIIFCTSGDSKPRIRVIKAGNYTYNLYTSHSGGTKIGSGTAVNDTAIIETTQSLVAGNNYFLETQNASGCVSDERTTVHIPLNESFILGPEKVCFGDNLLLSADYTGGKIVWTKPDNSTYNGQTLKIEDMGFEKAGIYSLLIEDSGLGCIMKDKIQVTVTRPVPPSLDKTKYRFYENEVATPLIAIPKSDFKLKWYNPEGTLLSGQSPLPVTSKTGEFIYSVSQDSLGCESSTVPVTVIVGKVPASVPASSVNICIADKPVIHIENTVKDYKYTVYYKDDVIAKATGNGSAVSMTSGVSIEENTELGIVVSDTYDVNSPRTAISVISVNNLIDMKNTSASVCDFSSGKLIAVDIVGAQYVWTTPDGTTINERSVSVTNADKSDAGIYTLSVTTSGCPAAQQAVELKVERPAKPSTTTKIYYCTGVNADKLTATPLSGYKLVWLDESQTQLSDAPVPNTLTSGISEYYVSQVSLSDANCVSDTERITVIVEDKPDAVVLAPVNICSTAGNVQPLSIRIPVSSEGYTYSVYSQETGSSPAGYAVSTGDSLPVDILINDDEISSGKIYYLEVKNKANCVSDRTPVEVIITEITLSPDELPSYQIEEFYSQKLITNSVSPQYTIVQGYLPLGFTLSATGDISGVASSFADPSVFTVEVTNSLGCSIQKEYTLKSELLVSKMFSPNGDGINDVFMKGYKVVIFDRLGRKLASSDDGWDGTYSGKVMPEDVYYYILYYKDKDGKEKRITSYVTLIKTI
ncbi:MAG: T9SS type B sorting domain-containing protein [Prevotellaceae bacterium]|jgi:gliding motility-associated-like protein|nr:T9SS type B sorting domain-containing protein [Prevotellaceae bacterium]